MADSNGKVQLTLEAGSEAIIVRGGIKVEFNTSGIVVYQNNFQVYPPANDSAPQADAVPAQRVAAENHPIGTEDAPGWQYSGVSPLTGKDYWIQTQDAGIMDHFNAVSYAKEHGVRLMSSAEGVQTYRRQGQLKGVFDKNRGYWLAERGIVNAEVQRFGDGVQLSINRYDERPVRCVRDDDPRLQR